MDFESFKELRDERAMDAQGLSGLSPALSASLGAPGFTPGFAEKASKEAPLYCAIALRSDLPPEHQIIQAAHAAYEAGARFGLPANGAPLHLALLEAKSERDLTQMAAAAQEEGIELALFWEPDGDTGATAFATQPMRKGQSRTLKKAKKWPGRRLGSQS